MTWSKKPRSVSKSADVFFPFPDGVYAYDCGRCHGACCRLGSIAVDKDGGRFLLEKHPLLACAFDEEHGGVSTYLKFDEGCWFLDRRGRCVIHARHGARRKPAGCRLHPFYMIPMDEHAVIADIEDCVGLRVGGGRASGTVVRHRDLLPLARETLGKGFWAEWKAGEAAGAFRKAWPRLRPFAAYARDICREHLADPDPLGYLARYKAAADAFRAGRRPGRKVPARVLLRVEEELRGCAARCLERLGAPRAGGFSDPGLTREAVAAFPYLHLFREGLPTVPDPRIQHRILLCLYLHAFLCGRICRQNIGLTTLRRLYDKHRELYVLLSRLGDTPFLPGRVERHLGPAKDGRAAAFLRLVRGNAKTVGTLSAILGRLPGAGGRGRLGLLKALAPLAGCLCYLEDGLN
ncbi:MAG: YkgJ family cysteine cluster protein [Elusimicrobia bacterium]|nr:YkgJ family cysteine cluster protein [Elusimicrobiota bacterium]